MFGQRDLSDAELLRMAAATALPLSRPSSPVQHLTNQFSTAQLSSSPNTATTTAVARPFYTSSPHIPVKLPPFDPKQPKRWFQQADVIFRQSHVVSSQDKWDYTLPKLPTDVLNDISDVVDSLTDATPNPYELAKNHLLDTYTPTRWQLARQLLTFPHVAGVCPTTLMNQLLSLLPLGNHPDTMFLLRFLDCLPANISAQLTTRTFRHLRDMAAYADQIWDSTPPPAVQVAAALPYQPCFASPASTVSLHSVSRSGRRHSQSPAPRLCFDYCYYHRRFGAAAHHCQAPCSWLGPLVGNSVDQKHNFCRQPPALPD